MSEPIEPNQPATPAPQPAPPQEFDLLAFWIQYRRVVMRAIYLVAVILLGAFGYKYWQDFQEQNSRDALAKAKTPDELRKVAADHAGRGAAAGALLQLAAGLRAEGKNDEAIATYKDFAAKFPQHTMTPGARLGVATILDATGKKAEALDAYQQVVSLHPGSTQAPVAMIAQARIHKAQGKADEARRLLTAAQQQVSALRGTAGAAGQGNPFGGGNFAMSFLTREIYDQDIAELTSSLDNPKSLATGGAPRPAPPAPPVPVPGASPFVPTPGQPPIIIPGAAPKPPVPAPAPVIPPKPTAPASATPPVAPPTPTTPPAAAPAPKPAVPAQATPPAPAAPPAPVSPK